jgi:hypothetical protein
VRLEKWEGNPNYITNRLWKRDNWDFKSFKEKGNAQKEIVARVRGESYEVFREELIKYFDNEPVDFLDRYRDLLHVRAEDASPGANIVSLYVHSIVTKKFYFLLNELIEEDSGIKSLIEEIKGRIDRRFDYKSLEELKNELDAFEKKKLNNSLKVNVIYYKLDIPHYIFRVHDLNLFRELKEGIEKIRKDYEDNFFFFFGFGFVVVCGDKKKDEIDSLRLKGLASCYRIIVRKYAKRIQLNELKVQLLEILKSRGTIEIKGLKDKIEGSYLCEVCRLGEGEEV